MIARLRDWLAFIFRPADPYLSTWADVLADPATTLSFDTELADACGDPTLVAVKITREHDQVVVQVLS